MKAFTLVELTVVILVMGLLAGLGLPSLNKAIQEGKKTTEIAALKSLITAYNLYLTDNNGYLLKSYDINGTATDINGTPMTGEGNHEACRWPWRLAPYFNYSFYKTTHVNEVESYIKSQGGLTQTYLVSVIPSFGLNLNSGGNDYENGRVKIDPATHINQISKPSQFITFVSSRSMAMGKRYEGFYYVTKPTISVWDARSNPKLTGYISARYSKQAVVAFLSGNVSMIEFSKLTNSVYWDK